MIDKTFLLKLIILAESDNETYKYLTDHQDVIPEIEKNGFKTEYRQKRLNEKIENEKIEDEIKLGLSAKLLQLPPYSDTLGSGRLAELFYLVGFFEEQAPDPKEFLRLSQTNPNEAIEYLKKTPGSWSYYIGLIAAEVNNLVKQAMDESVKLDNPDFITSFRNIISTTILSFNKYGDENSTEHKQLFDSFTNTIFKLGNGDNIGKVLANEQEFLNVALHFGSTEFWQQYMSLIKFNDFNNFNTVVKNIKQPDLLTSKASKPLVEKTLHFLEPNFDEVLTLIREKEMLKMESSEELQKQLVSFFTSHGEPQRTNLFSFLKESQISKENQLIIIDDLITKLDYQKLIDALDDRQLSLVLSSSRSKELKEFLIRNADFNNQLCEGLVTRLWQATNATRLNVFDNTFLANFVEKIKQIQEFNSRKQYINLLLNDSLIKDIETSKSQKMYTVHLEEIKNTLKGGRLSLEARLKAKITKFQTKLKGGIKHARRSGPRRK